MITYMTFQLYKRHKKLGVILCEHIGGDGVRIGKMHDSISIF